MRLEPCCLSLTSYRSLGIHCQPCPRNRLIADAQGNVTLFRGLVRLPKPCSGNLSILLQVGPLVTEDRRTQSQLLKTIRASLLKTIRASLLKTIRASLLRDVLDDSSGFCHCHTSFRHRTQLLFVPKQHTRKPLLIWTNHVFHHSLGRGQLPGAVSGRRGMPA